ncbi:MAG: acyltransferase family protein [Chryseolinea sp.]
MIRTDRRYDLDWVRVIAIGLLLIYHVAIGFQPWGIMIGFISNEKSWQSLWIPMSMLNVWRIPLLFYVSGMGVYFAIQNRSWKQLLLERAGRILLPFVFGILVIVPVHIYVWQQHYNFDTSYIPSPGHLWFLGNIAVYVILFTPFFYCLKRNNNKTSVAWIKRLLSNPLGLLLVVSAFVVEALLVDPRPYELYAMTWHGFFLGLLAFGVGFCFVWTGKSLWDMMLKYRWIFLAAAIALFTLRLVQAQQFPSNYQLSIESNCWIFSVFAFAFRYLNRPSRHLKYLSEAAYPIYIIHMVFLYLTSSVIFPLDVDSHLQFLLVLTLTGIGCFATYELIIRRVKILRPFFGLKMR